jgi:hypothetical protein
MILLAVLVEDRQAVAAALVGFGAALVSMAVLLPRLVGPLKISAKGFEAELIEAVQEQARARGLSPEETQSVIEAARTETDAWAGWLERQVVTAASGPDAEGGRGRAAILRLAKQYVEREHGRGPS